MTIYSDNPAYPSLKQSAVEAILTTLPPKDEQRRLAALVSDQMAAVERARVAADARLQAAIALPMVYLRDVFDSPETRLWPTRAIGDFAETCSGATPDRGRSDYYAGSIPWVKTGELENTVITQTEERITELALSECSLRLLPVGTLLVAMYGQGQTRGRTALLGVPATTNQACFAILPNPAIFDTVFLQLWFRYSYDRLRRETERRGGNQPNLNGVLLRRQAVPLPPLDVQKRCVAAVSETTGVGKTIVHAPRS
jgi:type I restriction enzyme S subunit